ncbi:hypothetical protein ACWDE9_41395, partial [Streptomyces olivaceoviridis]
LARTVWTLVAWLLAGVLVTAVAALYERTRAARREATAPEADTASAVSEPERRARRGAEEEAAQEAEEEAEETVGV